MQHLQEDFSGGLEVEAFPGCVVVLAGEVLDLVMGEGSEVCFAGQGSAQASDGVLDAFLPGGMGLTEERLDAEGMGEAGVLSELGSVVEGDGLAKFAWVWMAAATGAACLLGWRRMARILEDRSCRVRTAWP